MSINSSRDVRREHIQCWSEANQLLYEDYVDNGKSVVADTLLHNLDKARMDKWNEPTKIPNCWQTSRKAWSLLYNTRAC